MANPPESIQSGRYGQPPRVTWWLKQSIIYFLGLFGMKLCVFFIFQLLPWIAWVGDWALRWTEGNEALQVGFVMLVFPLVMNALQYYIIDGFIKDPAAGEESDGGGGSAVGDGQSSSRRGRRTEEGHDDEGEGLLVAGEEPEEEDGAEDISKSKGRVTLKESNQTPSNDRDSDDEEEEEDEEDSPSSSVKRKKEAGGSKNGKEAL